MLGASGELVAQNALAHAFYNGSFGSAGAGNESAAEIGSKQLRYEAAGGIQQGKYIHIPSLAYPIYLLYQ